MCKPISCTLRLRAWTTRAGRRTRAQAAQSWKTPDQYWYFQCLFILAGYFGLHVSSVYLACLPCYFHFYFLFFFVVQLTSLLKMIMWKVPAYTWTWLWIRHLHHSIEDSKRCRTWLLPRLHVGACPLWKKNSSPRWFFTRI